MTTEIELKAKVQNSEALRILLSEKAEYLGSFEKEDVYWNAQGLPIQRLRIRREKNRLLDGKEESRSLVTIKKKELKENIEINDEQEFEVKPIEGFEEFLKKMGFKPDFSKRKRGWSFAQAGMIHAELLELEGLGWFIELEILVNDAAPGFLQGNDREEIFKEGKNRLLDFLDSLGIAREAIESRYYSEMLQEIQL